MNIKPQAGQRSTNQTLKRVCICFKVAEGDLRSGWTIDSCHYMLQRDGAQFALRKILSIVLGTDVVKHLHDGAQNTSKHQL